MDNNNKKAKPGLPPALPETELRDEYGIKPTIQPDTTVHRLPPKPALTAIEPNAGDAIL